MKDAWVKATVADGKATIPSHTYLGVNDNICYFSYLWGSTLEYDEAEEKLRGTPTEEVVFTYDPDAKKLTLQDGYAICSFPDDYYLLTLYEKVNIYRQNRNVNTPPAKPYELEVVPMDDYYGYGIIYVNIPDYDEENNLLDTDKLYYSIYIAGERYDFIPEEYPSLGLTEETQNLPYNLADNYMIYSSGNFRAIYFDFELPEDECGVQSMYINEEGNEIRSEITSSKDSGVNGPETAKTVKSRTFYNLQGQPVSSTYTGPVITKTLYTDGTQKVTKSLRPLRR